MAVERLGEKEVLHTNNARDILKWNPKGVDEAIVGSAKQLRDLKVL